MIALVYIKMQGVAVYQQEDIFGDMLMIKSKKRIIVFSCLFSKESMESNNKKFKEEIK